MGKPADPMNVAMIGIGMVSSTYVDAFARSDRARLHGIYARSADSRAQFLEENPGPINYASLEELADDPVVDFVILTTPPNARLEIVSTLAKAGKHILMEKPVERTYSAARELCDICDAAGVTLGIVLQHRASVPAQKMRELVDGGTLGALHMVDLNVSWWRPQSYYDEPGRGTYERDGGGVMLTQAIHPLDLMLSFTGPVSHVTAMTATTAFHRMESEDFVSAGLVFENGAVGSVLNTTAAFPGRPEQLALHYENASVELARGELKVHYQTGQTESFGASAGSGSGADPMAFSSDLHRGMIEDFAQSLRSDSPPMVTGREALEVHRLIEALENSAKSGQKISL